MENAASSVAFCLERLIIGMGRLVPNESVTELDDFEWYQVAARMRGDKS